MKILTRIIRIFLQSALVLSSAFFLLKYGSEPILKVIKNLRQINWIKEKEIAELKIDIDLFTEKFQGQTEQLNQKESEVNQTQKFINISLQIRQHLNQKDVLRTTVEEIQDLLSVERVAICCFNTDCSGTVLREISGKNYPEIANKQIDDLCFSQQRKQQYKKGYVSAINDIYKAKLSECYVNFLETLGVRATLVAPILQGKHLFGLLIAHKCEKPRIWQKWEINLVKQLAIQVGIAISVAEKFEQSEKARLNAEFLVKEQCKQNERLQQKLIAIEGENNNTYYSADREVKQAQKVKSALKKISQISFSIQTVADSIQQAVIMTRDISVTAETGVTTMEQTFESILNLRSTVVEAGSKIRQFGDTAPEILKAVSSINQTAMQTNVLALNSSFDAHKTEENGRGFTIVAGEFGKLATQSSEASEEIKQIVESIEIENREVMKAIEKGIIQATEEVELIKNAKCTLTQIIEISRQLHESIFSATLSQVETFQSMMKQISQDSLPVIEEEYIRQNQSVGDSNPRLNC